ncbi:MAG: hypothetical protein GC134_09645 [Proteobacteria bacterium]|nr:hypothetical protein [Pseudomonadota bacterium]
MREALYFHLQEQDALARLRGESLLQSPELPAKARDIYNQLVHLTLHEPSFLALRQALEAQGGIYLDSGAFSDVYLVDGVVCKLTRTDRGYPHFVRLAMEHADNPHYPRIYLHRTIDVAKGFHLTLMEPLVSIKSTRSEDLFNAQWSLSQMLFGYKKPDSATIREIRQVVAQVRALRDAKSLGLDTQTANIMYRPADGRLVVTDPYVG